MKNIKYITVGLLVIMTLSMTGCDTFTAIPKTTTATISAAETSSSENTSTSSEYEFVTVYHASLTDENACNIVYQKKTKVMYAISNGGYSSGTVTMLVNADGTPLVYDEDK